ncbi:hypothetical protein MW887_004871 [Aspergillus wentii]|nr:hypothetical protein MW887_004871 [Aspergillus wentii]
MNLKYRPHLRVTQHKSAFAEGNARWTNRDLDPIPRGLRKWGVWSIVAYWISDAFNAATWQFASSIMAVGLSYRESLIIVAVSFFIISFVIAANGAVGAKYHIPFPVIARASWGFWGSYVAIISRVILAVFWFAIQNVNGGNAVRVMIGAIWPSFLSLKNDIPANQGITTNGMVAYTIFWLVQFPFLCLHPDKLRWVFVVKSVVVPVSWIAILVWAFSDFSRYSRVSPKWQLLYIPMLPIVFTFISFIGIAASSAGQARYGGDMWDPLVLISHWSSRACRFFAAFSFALASMGGNISANSISAANDFTALAPQYMNIRRGQVLCALLSWCLVPWRILASAGNFLNFMSAYAIFLGPIAAIMMWDFWIIKNQKYDTLALYQPWNETYRYSSWGVNWRAIVAFLVGVAPNLPGLINSVNTHIDVGVGIHPYQFGWLLGEALVERAVMAEDVYDEVEGVGVGDVSGDSQENMQRVK